MRTHFGGVGGRNKGKAVINSSTKIKLYNKVRAQIHSQLRWEVTERLEGSAERKSISPRYPETLTASTWP